MSQMLKDDTPLGQALDAAYRMAWDKLNGKVPNQDGTLSDKMGQLAGYAGWHDMKMHPTEESLRLMQALAGPHGYAIWKALQIRKRDAVVVEEQIQDK